MLKEPQVYLFDTVMCLSSALDLVSPIVVNHQKRVAYIALSIAAELGLSPEQQNELALAGALHDCGALSLKDKLDALRFDFDFGNPHQHAELGYLLLKRFGPFSGLATLVRYHHVPHSQFWPPG